jgi:glycosyltransferase involved in cell wall biosynthesis
MTQDEVRTKFYLSIIIPCKNSSVSIERALNSISPKYVKQTEIILIDDNSSDDTIKKSYRLLNSRMKHFKVIENSKSLGPGIARNKGLLAAEGKFILFFDSDDELRMDEYEELYNFLIEDMHGIDVVFFDFIRSESKNYLLKRRDHYFFKELDSLAQNFLRHRVDGAATTAIYSKEFLVKNGLNFQKGFYEDIDFIFKVLLETRRIKFFNRKVLIKHNSQNSITNLVNTSSIKYFLKSWKRVVNLAQQKKELFHFPIDFDKGICAAIAGRIKIICNSNLAENDKIDLLLFIISWSEKHLLIKSPTFDGTLQVGRILNHVWSMSLSDKVKQKETLDIINNESRKTWSCTDLHNSLFMAPNEIRTCCKRFFINDELKGDVVLKNIQLKDDSAISIDEITQSKRDLHLAINRGEDTPCSGCPFMEFKEWGEIENLQVKYLSMEHHSVCNLRCTYCDEKYYGGARPSYNVIDTLEKLQENGAFESLETVVWGGGEPLLDKNFYQMFLSIATSNPGIKQRVLSNSKIYSNELATELSRENTELITSIDAGTEDTFLKIRGRGSLDRVMGNLQRYATAGGSKSITIKFIFTDGNCNLEEVNSFIKICESKELMNCIFQISFDFKKDMLDDLTFSLAVHLYTELLKKGACFVFFDDLFYFRLGEGFSLSTQVLKYLGEFDTDLSLIKKSTSLEPFYIWGIGIQTKLLEDTLNISKSWPIIGFIDGLDQNANTKFLGFDVYTPEKILDNNFRIYISAVQSNRSILKQISKLNINSDRIIKEIIY